MSNWSIYIYIYSYFFEEQNPKRLREQIGHQRAKEMLLGLTHFIVTQVESKNLHVLLRIGKTAPKEGRGQLGQFAAGPGFEGPNILYKIIQLLCFSFYKGGKVGSVLPRAYQKP